MAIKNACEKAEMRVIDQATTKFQGTAFIQHVKEKLNESIVEIANHQADLKVQ